MAKLDLRKLVFTVLVLFVTLISAFGIHSTAAIALVPPPIAPCPTQSATLAITGQFTTTNLRVTCFDVSTTGLFLSAGEATTRSNTIGGGGVLQTVKTNNATYQFTWNFSPTLGNDTYTIKLVSTGQNAAPDVVSANLNGVAGVDNFSLFVAMGASGPSPSPIC